MPTDREIIDAMLLDLKEANDEHQTNEWYFQRFLEDNPNLSPKVIAYINGTGERPTDTEVGNNHYAKGLVKVEDAKRKGKKPPPLPGPVIGNPSTSELTPVISS